MDNGNSELTFAELECANGGTVSGRTEVRIEIFGGTLTLGSDMVAGKSLPYMKWTGSDGTSTTSQHPF